MTPEKSKLLVRRFSLAIANGDTDLLLLANLLGAAQVTMKELTKNELEEVQKIIKEGKVRILK